MRKEVLKQRLEELIAELDRNIRAVVRDTNRNRAITGTEDEFSIDPYLTRDPNGRYILLDALASKAQLLAALANLESSSG